METVLEIIERKRNGIDPTENESIKIKTVVKHIFELMSSTEALIDFDTLHVISLLFPDEYDEGIEEFEKN